MSSYAERAQIDVGAFIEKKGGLSYLSWSNAVDQLFRLDEKAEWRYEDAKEFADGTMMVFCTVAAFGISRTAQLPVLDYKNRPIPHPNAMEVNTGMQRCLVKAIALHGIGIYIYTGEDIPRQSEELKQPVAAFAESQSHDTINDEDFSMTAKVNAFQGSESELVDFVLAFCLELIPTIQTGDSLRAFWKSNKANFSRVKLFSAPIYNTIEAAFKDRAEVLKGDKK